MNNNLNQKISRNINPFQEDFSPINQDANPLSQTFQNINNNQYFKNVLGNEELLKETSFENKLKNQPIGKSLSLSGKFKLSLGKNTDNVESLKILGLYPSQNVEYLSLRDLPKISQNDYENLKNSIIDNDTLLKLLKHLDNVNCNFKSIQSNESVGCILPLTYLIESKFLANMEKIKEIKDKYNALKPYIYNYRTINGDGNCFYRAVMFRYLEILILNEKIDDLKNVINDIVNSFKSEELKKRTKINNLDVKPDLTFKILILIEYLLNNKMKDKAHEILVKSFVTCKKFDYAIILYFRYILYDYIKKNENKAYLKEFPIKIGNLLPSQYETEDGKFLFDSFYEFYLLNFYTFAEKIIIYLTPLVLGIELNVIIFDDNEEEILQKFKWDGNSQLGVNDIISLLNSRNHYEIIYNIKDNEKYKNIFKNYENNQQSKIIANIDELLKQKEINDRKKFNNLKKNVNELNIDKNLLDSKTMIKKKNPNINNNGKNQINNNINNQNYCKNSNNNNNNNVNNQNINNEIQINNNQQNYKNQFNNNNNIQNNNNQQNYKNQFDDNNNVRNNDDTKNINNNINNNQIRNINNNNNQLNNNIHNPNFNNMNNICNQISGNNIIYNNYIPNNQLGQRQSNEINHPFLQNNNNFNQNAQQNMPNKNNNLYHLENKNQNFGLKTPGENINTNQLQKPNNQKKKDDQIGFVTPGQNICMNCKKIEIDNTNLNICKFCLKEEIINGFYSTYLQYIDNPKTNMFNERRIELKLRNNEHPKIYSLSEAIDEYNKIYKNENLNFQKVINELKKRVCRFCLKNINKERYEIPCLCNFCSKNELELFLEKNFSKEFKCTCNTEYTREMMFNLGVLCYELDIQSKNTLTYYFNYKLNSKCCICGKTINIKYYCYNLISSPNQNQRNIDNFLMTLLHYFCEACYSSIINFGFDCQICKTKHFFNYYNNMVYYA